MQRRMAGASRPQSSASCVRDSARRPPSEAPRLRAPVESLQNLPASATKEVQVRCSCEGERIPGRAWLRNPGTSKRRQMCGAFENGSIEMRDFCLCGCGGKPNLIESNDRANNLVRGEYRKFIYGHGGFRGTPRVHAPWATRFWSKVIKTDYCWTWIGSKNNRGYGTTHLDGGKTYYAHRASYEIAKGQIPEGLCLDHLCRNTLCVNPDHLEAVTMRENCLRGFSVPAINARKTHCRKGHELSGNNLMKQRLSKGHRECLICAKSREKRRRSIAHHQRLTGGR